MTISNFYCYFLCREFYILLKGILFILQVFCPAGCLKCSNESPQLIKIYIDLVDNVRRPKILGNRVGILS